MSERFRHIEVTIRPLSGSVISKVCEEAMDVAHLIGGEVGFTFNGKTLIAKPDGSAADLCKKYWEKPE